MFLPSFWCTYLGLDIDRAEAIEELERGQDMALDHDCGGHRGRCPPSGHWRHLIEPLLQGELAPLAPITPDSSHEVTVNRSVSNQSVGGDVISSSALLGEIQTRRVKRKN